MTKKLEELLNLPDSKEIIDQEKAKAKTKEKAVVEQKEDKEVLKLIKDIDIILSISNLRLYYLLKTFNRLFQLIGVFY